jgi:hypothetical protein
MRRSGIEIYEDFHRVEVNKRSFFFHPLERANRWRMSIGGEIFPSTPDASEIYYVTWKAGMAQPKKKHTLRESMSKTNLCKFLDISRAKHPVLESFSTPQGVALRERPKKLRAEN